MADLRMLRYDLIPYAEALVYLAREAGYRVTVTSTVRSRAKQARLYRRWQQGLHPVPVAPPGTSKHETGDAFDVSASRKALADMGATWESWGGRWGGRFGDPIHFEG